MLEGARVNRKDHQGQSLSPSEDPTIFGPLGITLSAALDQIRSQNFSRRSNLAMLVSVLPEAKSYYSTGAGSR